MEGGPTEQEDKVDLRTLKISTDKHFYVNYIMFKNGVVLFFRRMKWTRTTLEWRWVLNVVGTKVVMRLKLLFTQYHI